MTLQDMHLHTRFSDGKNTPLEMAEAAAEAGVGIICFTDHVRRSSDWLDTYINEIKDLQKKFYSNMIINIGVETKIIDWQGHMDCPELPEYPHVERVAAIHRIPDGHGSFIARTEIAGKLEESRTAWMRAIEGIIYNYEINRIAHPFSLLDELMINKDDIRWWEHIDEIFSQANHIKIEYNIKYNNNIVPEWFWNKFKNRLVIGSDSHSMSDFKSRTVACRCAQIKLTL